MNFITSIKNKKIFHVTHNDLDGIGARIIAEFYIKPYCSEFVVQNNSEFDMRFLDWKEVEKADVILFTDMTPFPRAMYDKLVNELKKEIYIFDHHQTGYDELGSLPNYFFSIDRCGTKILYDFLTENKRKEKIIKDFVELVNTYDMWFTETELWEKGKSVHNILWGSMDWKKYNDMTDTDRCKKFVDNQLNKFLNNLDNNYFFYTYEDEIVKKANKKENSAYEEAKRNLKLRLDNSGGKYIYTECQSKVSLVAYRLLKEFKDIVDYIIIHPTWPENSSGIKNGKLSLRSNSYFNVKTIAEKWKGGGHSNASGLELSIEDFSKLKVGELHLI